MSSLPLVNYHSYEQYVTDLSRAENFYVKNLGFKRIGRSKPEAIAREGMERLVLAGGRDIHLILSKPVQDWSVAALYLKQHPEGVAFLNFRVSNLDKAVHFLKARKAAFMYEPQQISDQYGVMQQIAIATALDDVGYRFIDDSHYKSFGPSFNLDAPVGSYDSPFGFLKVDHVTSNVRSLQPLTSFYKEIMGFEKFWEIEFHTNDVNPSLPVGSGLYSEVFWHPESGLKFANNEPLAPFFRNSQIDIYCRDNRGSGVQHVALSVNNILETMPLVHKAGFRFLEATESYYAHVPDRLKKTGFKGKIKEDMQAVAANNILIDASEKGYLLQIFGHEMSRQLGSADAGPLFYEIIQREGDEGFGGGNFRALFETIEIDQIAMKKVASQLPLELI
jgi:4-hydroxyphenylpyruvate dioxygenase